MAKTLRIHNIAKELGVDSKDIVAKCQAEDIPDITNHMSTVSVGLAATIREWFSNTGGVATAVEKGPPVDVTRVRAKARKRSRKAETAQSDVEADVVNESEEASADEPVVSIASAPVVEPPDTVTPSVVAAPEAPPAAVAIAEAGAGLTVADESAKAEAGSAAPIVQSPPTAPRKAVRAPERQSAAPAAPERPVVMNVPQRPKVVKPVGPILEQPLKTKLSGPKVIRVEAPDVLPTPRARTERARPGEAPGSSRPPSKGGRGAGQHGPLADDGESGRGASRRNKRRAPETDSRRSARGAGPGAGDDAGSFNWREQDLLEREERLSRSGGFFRTHRRDIQKRGQQVVRASTAAETGGAVKISEPITVKELSAATGVKAADIIKKLMLGGMMVNINAVLPADKAIEVMLGFGIELDIAAQKSAEEEIQQAFASRQMRDPRLRPPVVTILGHVDHGKTSLLDKIRNTNIAAGEAGGITQSTRAFRVPVRAGDTDREIVFFDTPGHEAFTEMRARGARVTDLVVLVVAADDGVMPQTVESINHARAAGVPILVALNKIDKPEATESNIQRIYGQLAEHGLNPVEWGGDTEVVKTNALTGQGVQELLDLIDYQAQLHEWKADFAGPAEGTVIEAKMEEGRGAVAQILVQQGMLKRGDFIVLGRAYGRVRDIVNDRGARVESAGPSTPVAISGIDVLPDAGDKFYVVDSLQAAEQAAEERRHQERERELAQPRVTLDNIFERLAQSERKELRLIVKADVQGSLETLRKTLGDMKVSDVSVIVLHSGVGGVNESDITLAEASGAIIVGFNVTSSAKARQLADSKGIDIRLYDVIYNIMDDIEKAAKGLLAPEHRLEVLGHAEVRQVFRISKVGLIAGCYVTDGVIERNSQIRVTRGGIVVEKDRRLEQLKRFKDDVKEVRAGQECGMKIDGYDDIKEGDILECYKTVEVTRA